MSEITKLGMTRILELLKSDIQYIGIGSGISDNKNQLLDNEISRKIVTSEIIDNKLKISANWNEQEGNGVVYKNTGCFCNGATNTINTGTLFSEEAINISKDESQSLSVDIEITVEGG